MVGDFCNRVINECRSMNNVFIFVSKDDEIDTKEIIQQLFKLGKTVVVPVCSNDKIIMSRINKFEDLVPGSYGILEPVKIDLFLKQDIEIFFVPGTNFDNNGNRKGRGKGYFDRFLADVDKEKIIGLCYEDQIVDDMHPKKWDVPVSRILACKR